MTNAMDTLLALKCRTCGGEKVVGGTPINIRGGFLMSAPCPDCRHPVTKQPTGLLIPGLVEVCPCPTALGRLKDGGPIFGEPPCFECQDNYDAHDNWCDNCHGTGFVPVSEDTALRVLIEHPNCSKVIQWSSPGKNKWEGYWGHEAYDYNWVYSGGLGATPLEALAAAVLASVEVENHDN